MRVTVVGASGQFGAVLSEILDGRGVEVTRASRATGVDAVTGDGLARACAGADVIVDVTSGTDRSAEKAKAFFGAVARNVSRVAAEAGVPVVYLTIYGADDPVVNAKMGHYQGKSEQQRVYAEQLGDRATAVASTQWYTLPETFMSIMRVGPVAAAPRMVSRPADVRDVAEAMADVIADPQRPSRVVVAGPEVMDMADAAKEIAARTGSAKKVFAVTMAKGLLTGGLVPNDPDVVTSTTFDEWLAAR